ncbi:LysM peptidoglycan-binding domain-containing protein [Sporosarcina sp. PTS2304]|uniref:cell division suppressor protein YneA n=1 Tax=Sporosarcina sp. PTS2304 TaxID=2283194 RepID=UPI000E0DFF66|nr:LysM peptidoglycan-binding domain-containing protein [Sporosarcina sp. PTS2304]AXH98781.1 LysM peptidoglycan-binding domain-containing protein [Sporosarcina sp. PTS2304]
MNYMMKFIKENYYFALLLLVCLSFAWYQFDKLAEEDQYLEIVINEGDTLWELASNYSEGMPRHHWIDQVISLNELSTDQINSGELLRLPIKIKKGSDSRVAELGVEGR